MSILFYFYSLKHVDNLQIQHDNLVLEAREVQVAQLVPWVQADQPVRPLLEFRVHQVLLERPAGWKGE